MDFFSKNVLFTFSVYPLQKTEAEKENEKTQNDRLKVVEFVSMNSKNLGLLKKLKLCKVFGIVYQRKKWKSFLNEHVKFWDKKRRI